MDNIKSVKIKSDVEKFIVTNEDLMHETLKLLGADVIRLARTTVPRKNNVLTESGQVEWDNKLEVYATFGNDFSNSSDYARIQEEGVHPKTGTKFTNYTSPGTGAHFLEKAGKKVSENALQYFRRSAKKLGRLWQPS